MDSVASLMVDQDQTVTLINFIEDDDGETDQLERQTILENERDYLIDRGLFENQIEIRLEQVQDINDAIVKAVGQFDAIVMGETEPSVASKIFGTRHELVQDHTNGPVLIVRQPHNE
jgi:nucleotide-binding universal stress UspA family protein